MPVPASPKDPVTYSVPPSGVRICQILLFPWLRLLSLMFVHSYQIDNRAVAVSRDHTYLLAANHQSMLDPLVICGSLPWRLYHRLAPIYFMTANAYFDAAILRFILPFVGCFPAKPHRRYGSGVEQSRLFLSKKFSVWIFPEGKRTLPAATVARSGIGQLAPLPGVKVIPIHLQWSSNRILKRRMAIHVGTPFSGKERDAQVILDSIYTLPLE